MGSPLRPAGQVIVTDDRHRSNLGDATQRVRGNVRTPWMVANVFGEDFFLAVWGAKTRLDGNPGHASPSLGSG